MKPKLIDFHAYSLALIKCNVRVWTGFVWLSMADLETNEASVSVKAIEFLDLLIIGFPRILLNEVTFTRGLCYMCTFSSLPDPSHVTAVVAIPSLH
jgi:hypothetical protein